MVVSKRRVLLYFIVSVGFLSYEYQVIAQEEQAAGETAEEVVQAAETETPTEQVEEETPAVEEPAESVEEVKEEPPAQETPKEEAPAEQPDTEETPAVEELVAEEPAEEVKEETPAEESPKEEVPAEEPPAQETPVVEEPAEPVEEVKEEAPAEEPAEEVKEETPSEQPPAEETPKEEAPVEKPEKPAKPADEEGEVEGIDTVDLDEPQGNWLFKRIWWERAESKYEKARTQVEAVLESRMTFFAQRADLDKNVFDPFYIAIGLSQGELKEVLASLTARLEKEREQEGMLDEKEREFFDKLKKQKAVLEQLKLDVEAINKVDHEIDEALNKLLEQINRVRGYEREVWQHFKDIARVLSDKKAREIFYKIDAILKNISEVQNYIKQPFSDSFNKLVTTAKTQTEKVKSAVQSFKEKGVDFKKQLEQLEQPEPVPAPVKPAVVEDEELEDEQAPQGMLQTYIIAPIQTTISYIGFGLKSVWDSVVSVVRWPIDKLVGSPGAESDQEEE